ncbi:MAG: glycosyltransferase [Myxococcota bacterium]|jgi:L-malate glycosyltransferase|nr:glycosyltransferase [Myxococcota bacterium]
MVCPQFRPLVGGYERAAERLAQELARQGHSVEVVTERRDPSWPGRECSSGVTIHRLWCKPVPRWHTLTSALSLLGFFLRRGRQYDLIHIHQYGPLAALTIAFGQWAGKKVVLKLTNTGHEGLDAALPHSMLGRLVRGLHRRVDACICTSRRAADEAESFGISRSRVSLIPNALDVEYFRPPSVEEKSRARRALGVGDGFLAINVCRLTAQKNQALLVDAWADGVASQADALLAILGAGPLEEKLREQITRRGLDRSVRLAGQVSDPLPWYWAADLFVLSSDWEGLSNSLMEALCCGLPMLSTRVSGSEDVVEEAPVGRLVDPGDREALRVALEEMAGDSAGRTRSGEAARAYAKNRYALSAIVEQTLALYRGLLGTRRA